MARKTIALYQLNIDQILITFIYSFIYSVYFYSASSSPLLIRGAPDTVRIYCVGVSRRSATGNCKRRICQRSLYVAANAEFEPTTFRMKSYESTNELPGPHFNSYSLLITEAEVFVTICYSPLCLQKL